MPRLHPVSIAIVVFKAAAFTATLIALSSGKGEYNPLYHVLGSYNFFALVWLVTLLTVMANELGHRRGGLYVLLKPYAYSMLISAMLDAIHDFLALVGVELLRPLLTDYSPLVAILSYVSLAVYVLLKDPEARRLLQGSGPCDILGPGSSGTR